MNERLESAPAQSGSRLAVAVSPVPQGFQDRSQCPALLGQQILAARRTVAAWNLLGIADLVMAVSLGFLSSPGILQILSLGEPNVMISAYPLVMIPVFAVPLSILLHVCSLTKLSRDAREQSGKAPAFEPRAKVV